MSSVLILLWALGVIPVTEHPESLGLIPAIIQATEDATCSGVRFGAECGPLLIDAESFANVAGRATGARTDTAAVAAVINRPFSHLPVRRAYKCAPKDYPCMISQPGVYLVLHSLVRRGCEWEAVVDVSWASGAIHGDPREGYHRWQFLLGNEGGEWVTKSATLLLAT